MKRNLLTQIKNEWRDNLWLVIELAIVAVAIWALSSMTRDMTSTTYIKSR